jgi:hypothetical protein
MEIEDFAQTEVGIAVAVTAIATSPSIRKTLRKGAAYGLAGVLLAGDAAHRFANAVVKTVRHSGAESEPHELQAVAVVEGPGGVGHA